MTALNAARSAAGSQIRRAAGQRAQYPFFAQDLSGVKIPTLSLSVRCLVALEEG